MLSLPKNLAKLALYGGAVLSLVLCASLTIALTKKLQSCDPQYAGVASTLIYCNVILGLALTYEYFNPHNKYTKFIIVTGSILSLFFSNVLVVNTKCDDQEYMEMVNGVNTMTFMLAPTMLAYYTGKCFK